MTSQQITEARKRLGCGTTYPAYEEMIKKFLAVGIPEDQIQEVCFFVEAVSTANQRDMYLLTKLAEQGVPEAVAICSAMPMTEDIDFSRPVTAEDMRKLAEEG